MLTHVLIVAENATAGAMTRRHLRQLGCRVHTQASPHAIDWARQHLPDLIIWDGPDGGPFGFRDLRLHPATWNIPVVHLAGPPGLSAGLRVEADVRLDRPAGADFAEAIRRVVAARDERLAGGDR